MTTVPPSILEFWWGSNELCQLIYQKNVYLIESLGPARSYGRLEEYITGGMNSTHGNAVFGLLFPMYSKIRRTIFEKSAFFDLALYDYRTTFHFGILEGVE